MRLLGTHPSDRMTARAAALCAALSLAGCSGLSRSEGPGRSSTGGSTGADGSSGGTNGAGTNGTAAGGADTNGAGTNGAGARHREPVMLPWPTDVDIAEPKLDSEPLLLARDQMGLNALAVDADNVYWFNRGTFVGDLEGLTSNGDASVMKCARKGCGGQPTPLASRRYSSLREGAAFALAGGYLYWTEWPGAFGEGALVRCSVSGCDMSPEPVIARPVQALAADLTHLFGTEFRTEVFTCRADDCAGSVAELWTGGSTPIAAAIAVDASGVYWTTVAADGVLTCPATGCDNSPAVVMPSHTGLVSTTQLALDAENVYVGDGNACDTGAIVSCKKSGCPAGPTTLVDDLSPISIVTDGAHVYFAEQANAACGHDAGSLSRCAVNGCGNSPETLALGLMVPSAVAVDREFVFVADVASTGVWRLPKTPGVD